MRDPLSCVFSVAADELPVDENGNLLLDPIEFSFFDVAKTLEDLYISYKGRFVMMTPDGSVFVPRYKDVKTLKVKDQRITNKIICGHLHGHYSICVYAGSASSKFMCFDVDDGSKETVQKIICALVKIGFPRDRIYVSTSGGKGFHVEVFFSSLMFTNDLKNIYNYVCVTEKLDKAKVEFRPTAGQSIKLPLSIHRKTGNTCWYLNSETFEPIKRSEYIFEIQKVDHEKAVSIAKSLPYTGSIFGCEREKIAERHISEEERVSFSDDTYPDLDRQGCRHTLMFQIAVFNRYRGISKERCAEELRVWYHRQNPSFISSTAEVVEYDTQKILDWVYSEKFILGRTCKDIIFRRDDVRIIMAQDKRSTRMLMFLIQYYTKSYGSCCLSIRRMSDIIGLSYQTIYTSLKSMIDDGWVDVIAKSKPKKSSDGYVRIPNRYTSSGRAYNWAAGRFEYMTTIDISIRNRVFDFDMPLTELNVGKSESNPDIKMLYARVLTSFLSDKDLRKHLTKKEFKEIEETNG